MDSLSSGFYAILGTFVGAAITGSVAFINGWLSRRHDIQRDQTQRLLAERKERIVALEAAYKEALTVGMLAIGEAAAVKLVLERGSGAVRKSEGPSPFEMMPSVAALLELHADRVVKERFGDFIGAVTMCCQAGSLEAHLQREPPMREGFDVLVQAMRHHIAAVRGGVDDIDEPQGPSTPRLPGKG